LSDSFFENRGQACDFAILNDSPLQYFSMNSDAGLLVVASASVEPHRAVDLDREH